MAARAEVQKQKSFITVYVVEVCNSAAQLVPPPISLHNYCTYTPRGHKGAPGVYMRSMYYTSAQPTLPRFGSKIN